MDGVFLRPFRKYPRPRHPQISYRTIAIAPASVRMILLKGSCFVSLSVLNFGLMSTNLINEAKTLPLNERIELMEALWESIAQEGYEPGTHS